MAVALIFELLCVVGVVFMISFLVALSRDGRRSSRFRVVCLMFRHTETERKSFQSANAAGTALRSDPNFRRGFKVIAGRREQGFRRVG